MREKSLAGVGVSKSGASARPVSAAKSSKVARRSLEGEIPAAAGVDVSIRSRSKPVVREEEEDELPPEVDDVVEPDGRTRPVLPVDEEGVAARVQETPTRALFEILRKTGWAYKTVDFARLIGVRPKNAYMYLANGDSRIRASAETIYAWIRSIHRETDVRVRMTLDDEGVVFGYEGLTGSKVPGVAGGIKVAEGTRRAIEPSWMDEARERRAAARRKNR